MSLTAHRAHGLLRFRARQPQLFVHGEDVDQVHGVGALQERLVGLHDEVVVLQACEAEGRQVKFVQQEVLPDHQDVTQIHFELEPVLSEEERKQPLPTAWNQSELQSRTGP